MSFDIEINCADLSGTLSGPFFCMARSTFRDNVSLRVYGQTGSIVIAMPLLEGRFSVLNDGAYPVQVKRGMTLLDVSPGVNAKFSMDGGFHNLVRIG